MRLGRRFIAFVLLLLVVLTQQSSPNLISALPQQTTLQNHAEQGSMAATRTSRTTQTTYQTSTTGQTSTAVTPAQIANYATWSKIMSQISTPQAGCFEVTYPSKVWESVECVNAPVVPLQPVAPSTVGGGVDEVAYSSSGTQIGSSTGSFSVSGLTSETDSMEGSNYYSLQINSQPFSTNTPYTGNKATTGWEQFVFSNNPYGGWVYIQYWLVGYGPPCPAAGPPGGTTWTYYGGSSNSAAGCYANSYATPVSSEPASNLGNLVLTGYANFNSNGEDLLCISGTCSAVSTTDQILDLYQHWLYSEFNVFGWGDGSQANFNSGTSISVSNSLKDQNGNAITPSCVKTGWTAETNNLNLGSCSSNSNGQIVFTESNIPPTVTVTRLATVNSFTTATSSTSTTTRFSMVTRTSTLPTITQSPVITQTITITSLVTGPTPGSNTTSYTAIQTTRTSTSITAISLVETTLQTGIKTIGTISSVTTTSTRASLSSTTIAGTVSVSRTNTFYVLWTNIVEELHQFADEVLQVLNVQVTTTPVGQQVNRVIITVPTPTITITELTTVKSSTTSTSSTSTTASSKSTTMSTSMLPATTLNLVVAGTIRTTTTTLGSDAGTATTTYTLILSTATSTNRTTLSTGMTTFQAGVTTIGTPAETSASTITATSTTTSAGTVRVSQVDTVSKLVTKIVQELHKFVNETLTVLGVQKVYTPVGKQVQRVIVTSATRTTRILTHSVPVAAKPGVVNTESATITTATSTSSTPIVSTTFVPTNSTVSFSSTAASVSNSTNPTTFSSTNAISAVSPTPGTSSVISSVASSPCSILESGYGWRGNPEDSKTLPS